jgi:23S rRNA (guanine745-N1)-methyltransferase
MSDPMASASSSTRLACPVRGCGAALELGERRCACPSGHAFDVAREGYLNLLQPQARRSRQPGDAPAAVEARARLYGAGFDRALLDALVASVSKLGLGPRSGVLDVGSGDGTLLARLAALPGAEAYGVDLSAHAVRHAARRHPGPTWIVDNADRRLPFQDASLDLLLSVKGPKNPREFARVLAPGGRLLLVVPGVDDLTELRQATAGGGLARAPAELALASFATGFRPHERLRVREQSVLPPPLLLDLLASVYRGQRRSEAARAAELGPTSVTSDSEVILLGRER